MIPLLILGLLIQNPGSNGYELLNLMNQGHYQYIVSYTKGSFYYNLQQLEDKGYIKQIAIENAQRDSHHFVITNEGVAHFNQLMMQFGTKSDYINLSFYGALLFEENYPQEDMKVLIESQIKQTVEKLRLLDLSITTNQDISPAFRKMLENAKAHHQVNLEWFRSLLP